MYNYHGKQKKDKDLFKMGAYAVFVVIMVMSLFTGGELGFILMVGFIAVMLVFGFANPRGFDVAIAVVGTLAVIAIVCEASHAITAKAIGVPIHAIDVTILHVGDNSESKVGFGEVMFNVDEAQVNANKGLQNKMSLVAIAGSIGILAFVVAYLVLPTAGNFPSLIGAVAFINHQMPIFYNDQTYMIQKGWMSPTLSWFITFIGIIIMLISFSYALSKRWRNRKKVPETLLPTT